MRLSEIAEFIVEHNQDCCMYYKRFEYAKKNTSLPDKPDYKRINEFKMYVNERIVKGDI